MPMGNLSSFLLICCLLSLGTCVEWDTWAVQVDSFVAHETAAALSHRFASLELLSHTNETLYEHLPQDWVIVRVPAGQVSEGDFLLHPDTLAAVRQTHKQRSKKDAGQSFVIDPLYPDQWHLLNDGQGYGTENIDINVLGAWKRGITGAGVQIVIVDDGLQKDHPDVSEKFVSESSYSFADRSHDPTPDAFSSHGTSCAGVAAASANNDVCGVGAAYDAALAGIRILSITSMDADEAAALTYDLDNNMIYSNSWGPADTGLILEAPGALTQAAFAKGVDEGRGGKGSIYVWAAGNGLQDGDNCNYDGFVNMRETIGVGAIGHNGRRSYYSEPGASMLVTAPSSSTDYGITTIDLTGTLGADPTECTEQFGGTSSACPLVSGCVALMLQANPSLGWRDVQHILVHTSRIVDVNYGDWHYNGAGHHVSHAYGFGLIDASAAVELAMLWDPLAKDANVLNLHVPMPVAIPDGTGESVTASVRVGVQDADALGSLEHVKVIFSADHSRATDLRITVTSPMGTTSVLAEDHGYSLSGALLDSNDDSLADGVWADFSGSIPPSGITAPIVVANPIHACSQPANAEGAIVVVLRGDCDFAVKSYFVEQGGGLAVVVVDNVDEAPFVMNGGEGTIGIPAMMIPREDGNAVIDLAEASALSGSLRNVTSKPLSTPYDNWAFMTVHNWGESANGYWSITVEDQYHGVAGLWNGCELVFYGSTPNSPVITEISSNDSSKDSSKPSSDGNDDSSDRATPESPKSPGSRESDDGPKQDEEEITLIVVVSVLSAVTLLLALCIIFLVAGVVFLYKASKDAKYTAYDMNVEMEQLDDSSVLVEDEGDDTVVG